jgi:hypothetical protein
MRNWLKRFWKRITTPIEPRIDGGVGFGGRSGNFINYDAGHPKREKAAEERQRHQHPTS